MSKERKKITSCALLMEAKLGIRDYNRKIRKNPILSVKYRLERTGVKAIDR